SQPLGFLDRALSEGSHPARRDPDQDVLRADFFSDFEPCGESIVLGAFLRAENGFFSSGHQSLNESGPSPESRRQLRRFENAQAAARARSGKKNSASGPERSD